MNMGKKKEIRNEQLVNIMETLDGQEESSKKEMDLRLNQYIVLVVIALSTFGVLMYQMSKKNNKK
tara:strand:- start:142 stop:336 length:195 start_codon:yes stop_codon:yes gene_type:complete